MPMKSSIKLAVAALSLAAVFLVGRSSVGSFSPPHPANPSAPITLSDPPLEQPQEVAVSTEPLKATVADNVLTLLDLPTDFLQTAALYALVGQADLASLKHHIDLADKIPRRDDRRAALMVLYLRFSELDPQGVLPYLYASQLADRSSVIYGIFHSWAKFDLDGAMQRIKQTRDMQDEQMAVRAILAAYAEEDPQLMRQIADRLSDRLVGDAVRAQALLAQASTDPVAALKEAQELSEPTRGQTMNQIANILALSHGLAAALAYAEGIGNENARHYFRLSVFANLARQAPGMLHDYLAAATHVDERQTIVSAAMSSLAVRDPQRALMLANSFENGDLRGQAYTDLFSVWARADPNAAAAASIRIADPRLRERIGYLVLNGYASEPSERVLLWAQEFEGYQGNLWRSALSIVAGTDPSRALQIVDELSPSRWRLDLMADILGIVAQTDPYRALTHLERIPAGLRRNEAMSQIMQAWSPRDPSAALEWAMQQSPQFLTENVWSIAQQLAGIDLDLALNYTDLLAGQARDNWISAVLTLYGPRSPHEAAGWLSQFSEASQFGHWMGAIAAQVADRDPEAALRMIAGIDNSEQYMAARQLLVDSWARADPAAVGAWLLSVSASQRNPELVASVALNWYSDAPDEAIEWVMRIAEAEARDAGLVAMLRNARLDVAEAEYLLARIGSEAQRMSALTAYLYQLARDDVTMARALLARSVLPLQEREDIDAYLTEVEHGG